MANSVCRYVVGGLVGALAVLSANLTYAETLNQNLRIAGETPQWLVAESRDHRKKDDASRPVQIAQANKPLPGISPAERQATAAEIVGKMLAPGASNPDVPLPHPDLSEKFSDRTEVQGPLKGPTPYGRGETGGGILGFRIPIPVEHGAAAGTTTSSPVVLRPEAAPEGGSRP